jgi:hypothetical protein
MIEKTPLMIIIERAYGGRDIRGVLLDAIRSHDTDALALETIAKHANIDIDKTMMSIWTRRLGIAEDAKVARTLRGQPLLQAS